MSGEAWSRRSVAAAIAIFAASSRAWAQGPPPAATGSRLAPDLPQARTVLETAFDEARRLSVPVFVNGRGPFQFVVDTGSNRSVLADEVADACGLQPVGVEAVHGILGAEPATMVHVSRLRVGGLVSADLRLPKSPRSRVGADGILGLDMLRDRRILLNFQRQTFEIEQSGVGMIRGIGANSRLGAPGQGIAVPARFRSGQLVIIDARAASRPVTAFLDSGSQVTVGNRALRAEALAAQPDLADRMIHSSLMSATGQRAPAEFGPLPGLEIGGIRIPMPLAAYGDLHIFDLWELQDRPTVLIGVDVLRRFEQVAFDFARKLITFWPLHGGVPDS